MKKISKYQYIQAAVLLVISIAEFIVLILCKTFPLYMIIGMQLISLVSIAQISFAYQLAFWSNKWHSQWNRKDTNPVNDEPSNLAVDMTKAMGYIIYIALLAVLFI